MEGGAHRLVVRTHIERKEKAGRDSPSLQAMVSSGGLQCADDGCAGTGPDTHCLPFGGVAGDVPDSPAGLVVLCRP